MHKIVLKFFEFFKEKKLKRSSLVPLNSLLKFFSIKLRVKFFGVKNKNVSNLGTGSFRLHIAQTGCDFPAMFKGSALFNYNNLQYDTNFKIDVNRNKYRGKSKKKKKMLEKRLPIFFLYLIFKFKNKNGTTPNLRPFYGLFKNIFNIYLRM